MARPAGRPARLFRRRGATREALVVPGRTPVTAGLVVDDLQDFVVTADGELFVSSRDIGLGAAGILRVEPSGLRPVAIPGQPLPRLADGREVSDLVFGEQFGLMPDSSRGGLLFRAKVSTTDGIPTGRRGLFRLGPQGLETLLVEGLGVAGARSVTVGSLADSLDRQSRNGTSVFAVTTNRIGWVLYRTRVTRNAAGEATVTTDALAQEGTSLPGVPRFPTMDPSRLLSLPCRSGPLFSLNDSGAVALLASNGTRWGIYLFPAPSGSRPDLP
jgi:hypothetical protein